MGQRPGAPIDDGSFDGPWLKARRTLVWLASFLLACSLAWWIEQQGEAARLARANPPPWDEQEAPALPAPRPLAPREHAWATVAWRYFAATTQDRTGLAPSVAGGHWTTPWDCASALLALVAAHELGLLGREEFDTRVRRQLATLQVLPLHDGLPMLRYAVATAAPWPDDAAGEPLTAPPSHAGRLLLALHVLAAREPAHAVAARAVVARWNRPSLAGWVEAGHRRIGAAPQAQVRAGRGAPGYEGYVRRTLALAGLEADADAAAWQQVEVDGLPLAVRGRTWAPDGMWLEGLELGWGPRARIHGRQVHAALARRAAGPAPHAVAGEHHAAASAQLVSTALWHQGRAWVTVGRDGGVLPVSSTATHGLFAWHALSGGAAPAQRALDALARHAELPQGWPSGVSASDGRPLSPPDAHTNGVALESLLYIAHGPLLRTLP